MWVMDQNWPLILRVARALIRARHFSLSNKQVIRLVGLPTPCRCTCTVYQPNQANVAWGSTVHPLCSV